ncbi:MAG: maleylpyruvate isomerase family mycothiol-dependent enzyme [Actinomycetota bacterium]
MASGPECVALMREEWATLSNLCGHLTDEQWRVDTDCPGWTVKDQLSHLIGIERWILGHPAPEHHVPEADHVVNHLGERNEVEVDYRRRRAPDEVLEEFRAVTRERARALSQLTESEFNKKTWTPFGESTVTTWLGMRILDSWVHEQDIRRATGKRGHLSGPIPELVFERLALRMPKVVGKNAGAPDGSVVVFHVDGITDGQMTIAVAEGRANMVPDAPEVDVRLVMDLQTFVCLACGRWEPERTMRAGLVEIEGDRELGSRVVAHMNVLF